jgi:hypothetical protein
MKSPADRVTVAFRLVSLEDMETDGRLQNHSVVSELSDGRQSSWRLETYTCELLLLKPGLDGAWLGSFYVITDVIDKESYSKRAMYPAWRGAACDWASEARWIGAEAVCSRSSKGLGAGSCRGYTDSKTIKNTLLRLSSNLQKQKNSPK